MYYTEMSCSLATATFGEEDQTGLWCQTLYEVFAWKTPGSLTCAILPVFCSFSWSKLGCGCCRLIKYFFVNLCMMFITFAVVFNLEYCLITPVF